jgi:hypothetical protein
VKEGNLSKRVRFYCNLTAFILELIAIFLVGIGTALILSVSDICLWLIPMGGLLLGVAAFFQQKLPWAYTRFGNKVEKEEVQKEDDRISSKVPPRRLQGKQKGI